MKMKTFDRVRLPVSDDDPASVPEIRAADGVALSALLVTEE
jgi:hypothetical protein